MAATMHERERTPRTVRRDSPYQASFYRDVLGPLAERQAAGEDHDTLVAELYDAIHPYVERVIAVLVRRLPPHADPASLRSEVMLAAWTACRRIEWDRYDRWTALLRDKINLAGAEAARRDDVLPRRQRRYRNEFRLVVDARTQQLGRSLTPIEERELAGLVTPESSRTDWVGELLARKTQTALTDEAGAVLADGSTSDPESLAMLDEVCCEVRRLRGADVLLAWAERPKGGARLPVRLARLVSEEERRRLLSLL